MKSATKQHSIRIKRVAAAAVTAGMAVSMLLPVWAQVYDIQYGDITVNGDEVSYSDENGSYENEKNEDGEIIITGKSDENTVTIIADEDETVEVTLDDLEINVSGKGEAAITIKGDGDVELELNGNNTVVSGTQHAGIEKNDDVSTGSLTIKDEKNDDGTEKTEDDDDEDIGHLTATGGHHGAGIGSESNTGGNERDTSNIIIEGGNITANGGYLASGIGGGYYGNGSVTINGGMVTARGNEGSAGIGGGSGGTTGGVEHGNGTVAINGGTVTATGGSKGGAGIGGGAYGKGTVTITDGTVKAVAGGWVNGSIYQAKPIGDGVGIERATADNLPDNRGEDNVTITDGDVERIYAAGSSHKHNMKEEEKIEPTCTKSGKQVLVCTKFNCVYKEVKIFSATHTWDEGTQKKAPTCTEKGVMEYHCTKCADGVKTEKIAKLGHEWDDGVVTKEPTCTQEGEKFYTCTRGCTKTEPIPCVAENHVWDEGTITKQPTETEEGERTYTCTEDDCGQTRVEKIAKLEKLETENGGQVPLRVLSLEGTVLPYEHTLANGCAVFAAPAQDAILTGSLGALAELKAQGAATLVFRTEQCETSVSIDKLLAAGGEDAVLTLTHKGTQAVLAVEGNVIQ